MRCDLHVHSRHSGPADLPLLRHLGRESYSEPLAVYERARRAGMDLVTLTDHDSIEGALAIAHLPGTFLSEELTVLLPRGRRLHLGVFDITEAQHTRLAGLRKDAEALFAFLAQHRILACLNHPFSALTGARETRDLHLALARLELAETLNGSMPAGHNEHARTAAVAAGLNSVGGSDAHALAFVGRAHTVVPGARTKEEFLEGLRRGLSIPCGRAGGYARLTAEVTRIFAGGYVEAARRAHEDTAEALRLLASLALAPLLPLIPLFTAATYLHERWFGSRQFRRYRESNGWCELAVRPVARPGSPPGLDRGPAPSSAG